jgi:transcriptional regulator of acetoin/glycerol metabolism
VLVLEKHPAVTAELRAALGSLGYTVHEVPSVDAALREAASSDLLLLDREPLARLVPAAEVGTLNLEERERAAILRALEATGWNKQAAARLLGLHRPTLYSKMRRHGIPQSRPEGG